MADTSGQGKAELQRDNRALTLVLSGSFDLRHGCAVCDEALKGLEEKPETLRYETTALRNWDSSLVALLFQVEKRAQAAGVETDRSALPDHLRDMLEMALVREGSAEAHGPVAHGWLTKLGAWATNAYKEFLEFLDFSGQVTLSLGRLFGGKARMRWGDFWVTLQTVSVEALPIVALISFLVGLIIAFLGAVVLVRFGAQFAVAYLVGYGVLREMGAIMTGVIIAGRTGAAFAAQIGSMKVSEEIDALRTLGISPIDFLVLPRVVSLILMMPILTVFADIIGILGGYLVAVAMLDVPSTQFFSNIDFVAQWTDFALGLFKGGVFGVLIAVAGCLRGLQCERSADAVGVAATRAVVLAITLIIAANAIIDWAAARLNI